MPVMTKTVKCKKSKKGTLYLVQEKEGYKDLFISLIKEGKKYEPKLREGNTYDIEFTSYDWDRSNGVITLFNVTGI